MGIHLPDLARITGYAGRLGAYLSPSTYRRPDVTPVPEITGSALKVGRDAGCLVSVDIRLPYGVTIRSYRPSDRERVRTLCADTGFLGGSIERVLPDRELFADLYTNAYLEHERRWALVAVEGDRLLGYLLGGARHDFGVWLVASAARAALRMGHRLHVGNYDECPHARGYVQWLFERSWREQPRHPRFAAHMHFNTVQDARGRGVAYALWRLFESHLAAHGLLCYYGILLSWEGHRPERVYRRYGLEVYDRCPCSLLPELIPQPAEWVCVWRQLNKSAG